MPAPAAHHAPNIFARHARSGELLGFADSGAEQQPLAVVLDARRLNVSVEILFQLVVAGHFIDLAVFLAQAQPPALFLSEVIFDGERDDSADTGEGVSHHCDDGAVSQTNDG
jgi:hypothetical protein